MTVGFTESATLIQLKKNQEDTNKRLDAMVTELRQLNTFLYHLLNSDARVTAGR